MDTLEKIILQTLKKKGKKQPQDELVKEVLLRYDNYTLKEILNVLKRLEGEGKVFKNDRGDVMLWGNGLNRIYGTLSITKKGAGIVEEADGKITFIHKDNLNGAISGDKVIVKNIKTVRGRNEGKIEKAVDRPFSRVLCEVVNVLGKNKLVPMIENTELNITVNPEDIKNLIDGDRVFVDISLENKINGKYNGKILNKVCHRNDPNSDITSVAASFGFYNEFPDEVKAEVKNIPKDISGEDISNRVDYRDKMIFTIDGEDTKDIDDAISLEILPNGNYKLGVHIADVSHYVKPGTALFNEALKRGTSLYMLQSVIPMLPRELSNGICSLNPDEDRLAKTCEMEIDENGNIISSKIFDSVIRSRKKMSYNAVNEILEENIIPEGYEDYVDILREMEFLSQQMTKKCNDRGAIDFAKTEVKTKTDYKGRVVDVKAAIQRTGEQLIENFMLSANESVATTVFNMELPFIYRTHEAPEVGNLSALIDKIYDIAEDMDNRPTKGATSSKVIQGVLSSIKDRKEYQAFSKLLLRAMKEARYTPDNIGHYGLALKNYTHFTSPIRRFPDLLVHTLLNMYLKEDVNKLDLSKIKGQISSAAVHSSTRERMAQKAEIIATNMKVAEYMANFIGDEFEGTIINVDGGHMTVMLDNAIEGEIAKRDIVSKSSYKYDSKRKVLESENDQFGLGDRVSLMLKSASKGDRKINFFLTGHVKEKQIMEEKVKTIKNNCGQN